MFAVAAFKAARSASQSSASRQLLGKFQQPIGKGNELYECLSRLRSVPSIVPTSGFASSAGRTHVHKPFNALLQKAGYSQIAAGQAFGAKSRGEASLWLSLGRQLRSIGLNRFSGQGGFRRWSSQSGDGQKALYGLIAINGFIFLLWQSDAGIGLRHFTTSWDAIKAGRFHTLTTAAFSQKDTMHLASNMIALFFFGREVAYTMGGRGLILLYLAGGIFGNIVYVVGQAMQDRGSADTFFDRSYFYQPNTGTPALGSSGAVNSIVIFECCMAPMARVLIYGIIPMPAFALGALYLWYDIQGALGHGKSNVGYTTHLGGALIGGLAFLGVRRGRFRTRWPR